MITPTRLAMVGNCPVGALEGSKSRSGLIQVISVPIKSVHLETPLVIMSGDPEGGIGTCRSFETFQFASGSSCNIDLMGQTFSTTRCSKTPITASLRQLLGR